MLSEVFWVDLSFFHHLCNFVVSELWDESCCFAEAVVVEGFDAFFVCFELVDAFCAQHFAGVCEDLKGLEEVVHYDWAICVEVELAVCACDADCFVVAGDLVISHFYGFWDGWIYFSGHD